MTGPGDMGLVAIRARSDDAMSLLWRIVDDAMDPGYSAAAARAVRQPTKPGLGHSLTLFAALVALGALVAATLLQTHRGAPEADRTRADLTTRVGTATADTDALAVRVAALMAKTSEVRAEALTGSVADQQLSDRVQGLENAVGLNEVTGPGLEVVLSDGPPAPASEGGPDLARVLDQDLQVTVNGLFAAGAEAVSINGQRLTALSAIRGAGDAVLVGYRPLSPPYVLSAIGEPGAMETSFGNGSAASQLRMLSDAYGITFEVEVREELTLPGKSDLSLRYATPERP